jgi:hypothetical protein
MVYNGYNGRENKDCRVPTANQMISDIRLQMFDVRSERDEEI